MHNSKKERAGRSRSAPLWVVVLAAAAVWPQGASAADAIDESAVEAGAGMSVSAQSPWAPPRQGQIGLAFDGINVRLPELPVLTGDTMMVPARSLLEGLGYRLTWNAEEQALSVSRPSGPTLRFQAGLAEAQVDGSAVIGLSAPYIENDLLWIPLRFTAEASGLQVLWNEAERTATVKDPNKLTRLRVAARADDDVVSPPEALQTYMKSEWKTDAQFVLIPPDHYRDKTNLMIAAGDLPDLMLIANSNQYSDELFRSFASDLTDMLESFPRLKALVANNPSAARTIDGRIYGIPRPADPHDAAFPTIRKDWLDKLGLDMPTTTDQLADVIRKFAKTDPDGNGRNDTIGLTGFASSNGLGSLSWVEQLFTGSPSRFAVSGGQVIDTAVSDGEREALQWLNHAYADGSVDKEFPIMTESTQDERLKQAKVGVVSMTVEQAAALTADPNKADPQQQWVPLPALKSPAGILSAPWSSGGGMYIIPRMVTRDDAIRIMEWLDRGLNMTETDGWSRIPGFGDADRSAIRNVFGSTALEDGSALLARLPDPVRTLYDTSIADWKQVSYSGKTLPQADLIFSRGDYADINQQLEQLKIKVVLGKIPIEEWDRNVKELQASDDYRAMMERLNALLQPGDESKASGELK